ncbi:M15 family metallopeptidase [Streptomyces peucetius]|uniref:M15 family metallopeptidase n=1 Tax=Streptomyces peucetius TaxID=1950 RepID=A0ABY6IEP2_STRPE|nr:M15 family metallopeptidase [Streptomyces peucetius]UYQ65448.1 M15 family metallopeptidase [Streptomyces peucetius]
MNVARRAAAPVLALGLTLGAVPAQGAVPVRDATGDVPRLSATVSDVPPSKLGRSYEPGCPVPPSRLRLIAMNHWGFDGRVHRGELIVHQDQVRPLLHVFKKVFDERFPIHRMRVMAEYDGDDARAMAADNTSAFNCRRVTGDARHLSRHSYGDAVDINPAENPYVDRSGEVHPPGAEDRLDRRRPAQGMITPGDAVTTAMEEAGWEWGGRWSPPDYQHFSADGT